jgi:hypothetical protein
MKRFWLLAVVGLVTAALALGAVACSDDDDDGNGGEPTAAETMMDETPVETMMDETPMETMMDETPEDVIGVEITLSEVNGSGVTGMATIIQGMDADHTQVEVTIDGGLTEGAHQNHIHGPGSCDSPADVEFPLTELQAGADGSVPATTTEIETGMAALEDGSHYFAIHEADGTVVACGDIPAM